MKEKTSFSVSSGIKNIIGRNLITDDIVAIFELVKNSFDADAKNIDLLVSPKRNRIEIRDDGCGMTTEDVKGKWLFIAYSEKSEPNKKKVYAGSKGIGRFSCDTLGSRLSLFTRKNGHTTYLRIDWDDFEKDSRKKIGELEVSLETTDEDIANLKESGTLLVIESLRSIWSSDLAKKALERLKQLINPIETENKVNLTFNYESGDYAESFNEKVTNNVFESLTGKTTYVDCTLDDKFLSINLYSQGHLIYSATYQNPYSIKSLSSRIFFMDTKSKREFKNKTGFESVNYGNIFIFRNNFRVYPYGEKDFDIFNLNLRKSQGYNRYLGGRELLGWINIIDENNQFIETSSRNNGFINGQSVLELEDFYMDFIQKSLEKYVAVTKFGVLDIDSLMDNATKKRRIIEELTSHLKKYDKYLRHFEAFEIPVESFSIEQKVNSLVSEDIPQKQKAKIQSELKSFIKNLAKEKDDLLAKNSQIENRNKKLEVENKIKESILSKKKPERQAYMAHELTKASNDIDEIIKLLIVNPSDLSILADLKKVSSKLVSIKNIVLRTDLDTKSFVEIDLVEFIKENFSVSPYRSKKVNIIFENDNLTLKKMVRIFDFGVVLDNLYLNAKELDATTFKIVFGENNIIFVSDTGPINDEVINNAFKLGYSTKNGTGFGLYIVKEIVEQHGWSITMNGTSSSKNVYFDLRF